MFRDRKIATSSLALLSSNIGNRVTGFFIMLSVARYLGAERFGLYNYVFSYVATFALLTDLGLTTVVTRRINMNEEEGRRSLGNALLIRWPLAIATYTCSVAGAWIFYGPSERTWLIALSSLSYLTVPLSTFSAVFHARMRLYEPAFISLISRLLLFTAIQAIARLGGGLSSLIITEFVVGAVSGSAQWYRSRTLLKPKFGFDRASVLRLMTEGLPLFISSIFTLLYFRVDVFFLGYYSSDSQIGNYASAYRLTESLLIIATALSNSIFPVLCQHEREGDKTATQKLVQTSLKILLICILPISILLTFYSNLIIQTLYGHRFDGSARLLSILAWVPIFSYCNILFSSLIIARGKGRSLMLITLGMLLINVLLNFVIIPQFGAAGAAATTLATELAGTVAYMTVTSSIHSLVHTAGKLMSPMLICIVILAYFAKGRQIWNFESLWPMMVVTILYPMCLIVFRVLTPGELRRLGQLIRISKPVAESSTAI